uniref:Uncharacterized protein n=1 Tax=Tetranychus urticae TaxID=32264 RepID=T1KLK7_TETUR
MMESADNSRASSGGGNHWWFGVAVIEAATAEDVFQPELTVELRQLISKLSKISIVLVDGSLIMNPNPAGSKVKPGASPVKGQRGEFDGGDGADGGDEFGGDAANGSFTHIDEQFNGALLHHSNCCCCRNGGENDLVGTHY